jgi:hypothetical protein
MELISFGNSQKEIADILHCSVNTIDVHVKNIKHKTGLQKATEISCAYMFNRYHLPMCDLPEGVRRAIAVALLSLSVFSITLHTTDFIRVMRPAARSASRGANGRTGKRDSINYLNVA